MENSFIRCLYEGSRAWSGMFIRNKLGEYCLTNSYRNEAIEYFFYRYPNKKCIGFDTIGQTNNESCGCDECVYENMLTRCGCTNSFVRYYFATEDRYIIEIVEGHCSVRGDTVRRGIKKKHNIDIKTITAKYKMRDIPDVDIIDKDGNTYELNTKTEHITKTKTKIVKHNHTTLMKLNINGILICQENDNLIKVFRDKKPPILIGETAMSERFSFGLWKEYMSDIDFQNYSDEELIHNISAFFSNDFEKIGPKLRNETYFSYKYEDCKKKAIKLKKMHAKEYIMQNGYDNGDGILIDNNHNVFKSDCYSNKIKNLGFKWYGNECPSLLSFCIKRINKNGLDYSKLDKDCRKMVDISKEYQIGYKVWMVENNIKTKKYRHNMKMYRHKQRVKFKKLKRRRRREQEAKIKKCIRGIKRKRMNKI